MAFFNRHTSPSLFSWLIILGVGVFFTAGCDGYYQQQIDVKKETHGLSAYNSLRVIHNAQTAHMSKHGKYATLRQLGAKEYLDNSLATGKKSGFTFSINVSGNTYTVYAKPLDVAYGKKRYYMDQTGVIRATNDGSKPGPHSPQVTNPIH